MSFVAFSLIALILVAIALLSAAYPWLRKSAFASKDTLSNVQVIKHRISELEREYAEGLLSLEGKDQAVVELKLALVDENERFTLSANSAKCSSSSATIPVTIGALLALITGVAVYANVNNIHRLVQAQEALDVLPEISIKLGNNQTAGLSGTDRTALTLAIRSRLRQNPADHKGWMYLGRLLLFSGQTQQAEDAITKARQLNPGDRAINLTAAEIWLATGEQSKIARAQRVLGALLRDDPANAALGLLMAVASAQLGDLYNAEKYLQLAEPVLGRESSTRRQLETRIAELKKQYDTSAIASNQTKTGPEKSDESGFELTINVAPELLSKIPLSGYLIVFAQDALSNNKMPAAVVKIPLPAFPHSISLTSANAMLPNYSLAMLERVKLVARISADENVGVTPGELQGSFDQDVVRNQKLALNLMIDQQL